MFFRCTSRGSLWVMSSDLVSLVVDAWQEEKESFGVKTCLAGDVKCESKYEARYQE